MGENQLLGGGNWFWVGWSLWGNLKCCNPEKVPRKFKKFTEKFSENYKKFGVKFGENFFK